MDPYRYERCKTPQHRPVRRSNHVRAGTDRAHVLNCALPNHIRSPQTHRPGRPAPPHAGSSSNSHPGQGHNGFHGGSRSNGGGDAVQSQQQRMKQLQQQRHEQQRMQQQHKYAQQSSHGHGSSSGSNVHNGGSSSNSSNNRHSSPNVPSSSGPPQSDRMKQASQNLPKLDLDHEVRQ